MTKQKKTKRALFASVISMLLCVAMLIGSTFAWFTDTASTKVNSIQAGTLDIQLVDAEGRNIEGQTLEFKDTDENLWEPGVTYTLNSVYVKNAGNLALKYKIIISGINGDAKLNEAIEWTINGADTGTEYKLAAGATSDAITIEGHMKEDAGNEYQGLSVEGIAITVVAGQDTVEFDSTTNQYDKDAKYGEQDDFVTTSDDLVKRLKAAEEGDLVAVKTGTYEIGENVTTKGTLAVYANENVTINMTNDAALSSAKSSTMDAPTVYNAGTLTIKGGTFTNKNATVGNTDVAAVYNANGTLTLDGCTLENTAPTSKGDYCLVVEGGQVGLTNCTIKGGRGGIAVANDGFVVMEGGSVSASAYYPLYTRGDGNSTFNNVTFKQIGSKVRAISFNDFNEGTATFTNCTFESNKAVKFDVYENMEGFTFSGCTYTNVTEPN